MSKSLTLQQLAELTTSTLIGDPNHRITGVEDLEMARGEHASFLDNPRYHKQMLASEAGVIFLQSNALPKETGRHNFLVTPLPSLAFQKVIEYFIEPIASGFPQIDPSSVIHPTVQLEENVTIGPHVSIAQGVRVGKNSTLSSGTTIGASVTIGEGCLIHPHVVIRERCEIGNRVIIQPGAVIGSCGFGYFTDAQGNHIHLKQLGNVVIEDDVEIGANTTIDRARFKTTRIGKGSKIDNLVHIAHQVSIGEGNLIVAQVGIAGSTKTGKHVVMGGQAGVAGHISLADGVVLTARCAVSKTLEKADVYYGAPAMADKEFKEHFMALRRVGKMAKRFQMLEKKFAHLLQEDSLDDE